MKKQNHILIVDDETDIRDILRIYLESKGYVVSEAINGCQAVDYVRNNPDVDLIIMDIIMPELSGIEACRTIREISVSPILFLTAKSGEDDMLDAYSSGGDDYLCKPFSRQELLMKINSMIRRYRIYQGKETEILEETVDDVKVDHQTHRVTKGGETVDLTETEFRIFAYLMKHRGQTVTACELYENVWDEKYMISSGNTVMVHILNLRRKLEMDPKTPQIIRTIWGKGYQIDE